MTARVEEAVTVIRTYMQRHSSAVRPVPLAKVIGVPDIRVVRAALAKMSEHGEVVSCDVIIGEEHDKEYRLAAGGAVGHVRPLSQTFLAPRRPDASKVPSRMTDLPASERPKAAVTQVSYPSSDVPFKEAPASSPTPTTTVAPKVEPAAAVIAPTPKAPPVGSRTRSDAWHGQWPVRQNQVLQFATSLDRPFTVAEIVAAFQKTEPALRSHSIYQALSKLCRAGFMVSTWRGSNPMTPEFGHKFYTTKEVAAKLASDTKGSDGEATPPERAVPGGPAETLLKIRDKIEAWATAAAPLDADKPEQKTVQDAPRAPQPDARRRLEGFIGASRPAWHSLSNLVRVAGGDVPVTLATLAELQRDGRVRYGEADFLLPIWQAVEGRW